MPVLVDFACESSEDAALNDTTKEKAHAESISTTYFGEDRGRV